MPRFWLGLGFGLSKAFVWAYFDKGLVLLY